MNGQLLFVLLIAVANVRAGCPSKGFMETLDLNKFMGIWYHYADYGQYAMDNVNRCIMSTYELQQDGKTIRMVNDFVLNRAKTHVRSKWTAKAMEPSKPNGKLKLKIKLPGKYGEIPFLGKMALPLMVLDTDYENYAVLYACKNFFIKQIDFAFVFTRKPTADYTGDEMMTILDKADKALAKVGASLEKFKVIDQKDCNSNWFRVHTQDVGEVIDKLL